MQHIATEVYARLDPCLYRDGVPSRWAELHRQGAATHSFLEGPVFDDQGRLICVDIAHGRLFRISSDGRFEVVLQYEGAPNGLARNGNGEFYVADFHRGLLRWSDGEAQPTTILTGPGDEEFLGLNDLTFDSSGALWFTDQGLTGLHDPRGKLYRWTHGQPQQVLGNIPSPNGLIVSPNRRTVYLAVTRANAVWRVPLDGNGQGFKVGLFCQMSGGIGPDGMAADEDGNLFVCHPGTGSIWVFDPTGRPIAVIKSCAGLMTTNCALNSGGLYITESETGSILFAKWKL